MEPDWRDRWGGRYLSSVTGGGSMGYERGREDSEWSRVFVFIRLVPVRLFRSLVLL